MARATREVRRALPTTDHRTMECRSGLREVRIPERVTVSSQSRDNIFVAGLILTLNDIGPTLVTGATGFLGRHVLDAWLASARPVSALTRRVDAAARPGAQWFRIEDLCDRVNIRRALAGIGTVIHLAARAHVMRELVQDPLSAYRKVNVEGTRVLLEEAVAAGVRHFVFVSSVKAMGERAHVPWTEASQPCPSDAYGVTKLEAERLVQDVASRTGLRTVILRLPLVYGEGMRGNMLQLFTAVARGWPLPFRSVRNGRSY